MSAGSSASYVTHACPTAQDSACSYRCSFILFFSNQEFPLGLAAFCDLIVAPEVFR